MSVFCSEISKACGAALLSEFMFFLVGRKQRMRIMCGYRQQRPRGAKATINYLIIDLLWYEK